jgi:hypothetical protein
LSIDLRLIDVGAAKVVAISSRDTTGGIETVMTTELKACARSLPIRFHNINLPRSYGIALSGVHRRRSKLLLFL